MTTCFTAVPGVDVITTTADIPALGSLAINAFVLHGTEPVLVDTGTVAGAPEFMTTLASVIDPAELRWIWLTHTDFDHIGSLATLLDAKPEEKGSQHERRHHEEDAEVREIFAEIRRPA